MSSTLVGAVCARRVCVSVLTFSFLCLCPPLPPTHPPLPPPPLDMINMISLEYTPRAACWVYKQGQAQALLAVSDQHSANVYLYDGKAEGLSAALETLPSLHTKPVTIMAYNPLVDCVVSADEGGMIEYWSPSPGSAHEVPGRPHVQWEYKSDTDLYDFVKCKSYPTALVFSPDYTMFATFGISDRQVRIFKFRTGKLVRKYDESLKTISEMQQAGTAVYRLDSMEFGRRLAVERELEKSPLAHTANLVFDESSNFLLYPTLLGIKVINLHTNNVVSLIGKGETTRFLNISMYQGSPKKKVAMTLVSTRRRWWWRWRSDIDRSINLFHSMT